MTMKNNMKELKARAEELNISTEGMKKAELLEAITAKEAEADILTKTENGLVKSEAKDSTEAEAKEATKAEAKAKAEAKKQKHEERMAEAKARAEAEAKAEELAEAVKLEAVKEEAWAKYYTINGLNDYLPNFTEPFIENMGRQYIDGMSAVYIGKSHFCSAVAHKVYMNELKNLGEAVHNEAEVKEKLQSVVKCLGISLEGEVLMQKNGQKVNRLEWLVSHLYNEVIRKRVADPTTPSGKKYINARKAKSNLERQHSDGKISTNKFTVRRDRVMEAMKKLENTPNTFIRASIFDNNQFKIEFESKLYTALTGVNSKADFEALKKKQSEALAKAWKLWTDRAAQLAPHFPHEELYIPKVQSKEYLDSTIKPWVQKHFNILKSREAEAKQTA